MHTIPPRQFIMDRSFVCYDQKTSKYDIKFDKCRNGNFCGASFCNPRATNVIVNSRTGKATGYIYKIFVSPSSVCCLEKPLDVFVISFPKESTQVERTLLVSAVLFNHFILFEQDREY
uniref:Phospholipid scramblase n=1 Tax=Corethron hystrix TaxID=216773 RepID=A0A7S1FQM6_9STRA